MIAKRIFDLLLVIPGLLILLPIFLLIMLWIKIDSQGKIFFSQKRIGQFGQPFMILKFRTMVENAEALGTKVTIGNDPRITGSGAFLRKYKLDELPQLLNVLKGEMSFVGPRPEVEEYVAYWPLDIRDIVLSVPPGITDFAAIEFRNESEILQLVENPVDKYIQEIIPIKLNYYVKYVEERSLYLDLLLIFRTIKVVIK